MPLILPANTLSAAGYEIANSCRFDIGDTSYLTFTQGAPTDANKWTVSCWVKKSGTFGDQDFISGFDDSSNHTAMKLEGDDTMNYNDYQAGDTGKLQTTRKFRDPSAWYHYVFVWDSDNGTAGNRMRFYVNGVEETSFSTDSNPSSGQASVLNENTKLFEIGRSSLANYFSGYLAEIVFSDGQAYAASDFGEFNSDSPTIWQPKDPSGLTFGDNGFWLDFENSAALGNDVSGNDNDFTPTNLAAADQATDTPTNNFAVLNSLTEDHCSPCTFSQGNCKTVQDSTSYYAWNLSTMGMSAGKWYFEDYIIDVGTVWAATGITSRINPPNRAWTAGSYGPGYSNDTYGIAMSSYAGSYYKAGGGASTYGAAYTTNAVISVALDLDNNKCYFAKDGAWGDGSGTWDSTTFDAAVGDIALVAAASATDSGVYHFAVGNQSGSPTHGANFGGCPPIAPSSGNADADGYGNFEYAVPSGFYALCTKNLGAYGG